MSFSSVLVANRGEIARRVIRACAQRGLRSIAVYSEADADAPFVHEADHAVLIGPTSPTESYLDIDRILAAAKTSGAEAVHPGYGFLSERSAFARAVTEAGLVFIGPTADVMDVMGRKDRAREVATRAGVPVTPRYDEDAVPDDAYPVLVKAAAGGGGKGMHVVRAPADLPDAVETARREARSAFGDDTLLIETYVEHGKHVEVQVFGDEHGHVVHLADRDCSAQRRHQKIVEEAPAPFISDAARTRIRNASVALCREVGYTNAGTVEFLVSPGSDGDEDAYFLEMNTRLQVEHPVTEEVTGVDLVHWQLDVAAGRPLPMTQEDLTVTGHAIEVRVYAEDPYAGFLPQSGSIEELAWPTGMRIEAAFDAAGVITTAYDPMVAKIVAHGADREAARLRLVDALDETAIFGLTTNLGFVRRLVASDAFASGQVHTSWLDGAEADDLLTPPTLPDEALQVAADVIAGTSDDDPSPFARADGWRLGATPAVRRLAVMDLDGVTHWVEAGDPTPGALWHRHASGRVSVSWQAQPWILTPPDPMRHGRPDLLAGDAEVTSPMPGTVLSIDVAEGDAVTAGQRLGAVEAMKMELTLTAPHDGVVTGITAAVGDQVGVGRPLLTVEAEEPS